MNFFFFLIKKLGSFLLIFPIIFLLAPIALPLFLLLVWELLIKKVKKEFENLEFIVGSAAFSAAITVPLVLKLLYFVGVLPIIPSEITEVLDINCLNPPENSPENSPENVSLSEKVDFKEGSKKKVSTNKLFNIGAFIVILGWVTLTIMAVATGFEITVEPDQD